MIKLYLMEASPFLDAKNRERALALSDDDRKERVARMKQEKGRALSTAAGLLLSYAVAAFGEQEGNAPAAFGKWEGNVPAAGKTVHKNEAEGAFYFEEVKAAEAFAALAGKSPVKIKRTPGGKPFLESPRGLFFNLSHSGDYAVCAVADREVGVDIQKEQEAFFSGLLNKVLHEEEKPFFFTDREKEGKPGCIEQEPKAHRFYKIWAAKEAYVKCTGEGLAKDFKELLTDFSKGEITDLRTGEKRRLYGSNRLSGYRIALCVPYTDFTQKG